ncbi:hypothetical protein ACFXJ8_28975 [Nonomuraea sp. NPDC059194]|uniref:hypothetical protein n=1 Tax=Nonomuraea sp. NPDC059194 TaxID=3346764 RepID=UPI00369D5F93
MPHVLRPGENDRFRLTLNSDGRSHPIENMMSVVTVVLGLVAFGATFFPGGHVVSSWAGALGFGVGLYSQYISATTPERALNIVGIVASFVGAALGIARGGFIP